MKDAVCWLYRVDEKQGRFVRPTHFDARTPAHLTFDRLLQTRLQDDFFCAEWDVNRYYR